MWNGPRNFTQEKSPAPETGLVAAKAVNGTINPKANPHFVVVPFAIIQSAVADDLPTSANSTIARYLRPQAGIAFPASKKTRYAKESEPPLEIGTNDRAQGGRFDQVV
jgi:hypothetical protein